MIKLITPGAYDYGEATVQMINISRRGLIGNDRNAFLKRASATLLDKLASQVKLGSGEVPVHIIALGSHEGFGCNRNGDSFYDDVCRKYHDTFVKHAHWFRHHQNKDPSKSRGHIKLSCFNENMKRIELVGVLYATKEAAARNGGLVADLELEKLARGEDLPTSMGCVLDPTYPVLTRDRGYVAISELTTSDYVWSHAGRWCRVKQLNRRVYTGDVYTFRVNGLPLPLQLTADHPMWAKRFEGSRNKDAVKAKARRYFADAVTFEQAPAGWYHVEHLEEGDRFFYKPITTYSGYGRIACTDLAAVMGYYLAEGSFAFNGEQACTTIFSCSMDDALPRRLPGIVQRMYPDITVDIRPKSNSDAALEVCLYSTTFSEFLRKYVGRGCRNKAIPPEIFNSSREVKLAFVGAWLDGDGWLDNKGCHWSSASYNLVLQGRDLLASLGIPSSIYRIQHQPSKLVKKNTVEYTLNVSHLDVWQLTAVSEKAANYPVQTRTTKHAACMRLCPDGTYAYRISDIEKSHVVDAQTYNIEVEDDESYSLGGLISHNCHVSHDICSGCGNKAKYRRDYCDETICHKYGGLKDNIGRTYKDGHTLHAINPDPRWFDMSLVHRNADRISFGMGVLDRYDDMLKAASAGHMRMSGAEWAERLGITTPKWLYTSNDPWAPTSLLRQLKVAGELIAAEDALQSKPEALNASPLSLVFAVRHDINDLPNVSSGAIKLGSVMTALHDRCCLMPLREFLVMVTGEDTEKVAAAMPHVSAALPGAFNRLVSQPDFEHRLQHNPYLGELAASSKLHAWAVKCASQWSLQRERVIERLQLAAIRQLRPKGYTKLANYSLKAEKLADEYALYELAFLAAQPDTPERKALVELVVHGNYYQ